MSTDTPLAKTLRSAAAGMRAEFDASTSIRHQGGAGTRRELIVHHFIADYLPGHAQAVHGGEIVTASGDVSPQCDVLVVDRGTPLLQDTRGHPIVLNECVYGVIEVKTRLDGRQLADACEKIRSVKALPKTAYRQDPFGQTRIVYGRAYSYVPTTGMIFAFRSIALPVLAERFRAWCSGRPLEERPNGIWVLGKGFIVWSRDGLVQPGPEPGSDLVAYAPEPDVDVLLMLVIQLNAHFADAWSPPVRLADYAASVPLGKVVRAFPPDGTA